MDKRQDSNATSTQAETSGCAAQDREYAKNSGGRAKKLTNSKRGRKTVTVTRQNTTALGGCARLIDVAFFTS